MGKKKILIYVGIIIVICIVVPMILYFLIDKFDVVSSKINADNWLMFWATYLAGTLGGLTDYDLTTTQGIDLLRFALFCKKCSK